MDKKKLIIFGTSKVADILYSCIKDDLKSVFELTAFTVDEKYYQDKERYGLPVVRFEEVEKKYNPKEYVMIIAMGYHKMNSVRADKCREAEEKGYTLASFVHSKADVPSTVRIGKNVIILNGVSVGPFTSIGNNVCIYSGAVVSHHANVESNSWITSGTVIGGNSSVGENCFLGINSTIGHNVKIGNNNFIGANATITKNTEDDAVYILPDTPKYRLNTLQFMKIFKFE